MYSGKFIFSYANEFIAELATSLMLIAPDIFRHRQDNAGTTKKDWHKSLATRNARKALFVLPDIHQNRADRNACELHQRVEFEGRNVCIQK